MKKTNIALDNIENNHGGCRLGAGRPSRYGSKTKPIRVPEKILPIIQQLLKHGSPQPLLPLYGAHIAAGLPTTIDDQIAEQINLFQTLVPQPEHTFLVRAMGLSMIDAGIFDNDLLIVSKKITPVPGKIIIAALNGQLTVKKLHKDGSQYSLLPANVSFKPIVIQELDDFQILGVVMHIVHSVG